ncbi:arsinothricin resistance N-acetyltransferase ArsN1 family B [Gallaecimonas mangrovi]|uniref:arsinothricin resistance N-acetyltransferase ArsN1 family B n=1 Tax=Gallaecimonas mangrovi TaxID=2291597 RepID=UPI000E200CC5|nr:arsinothricin resistance N-acetyltransferase ArsN1 family B [Gallaecimonas mangrovi]
MQIRPAQADDANAIADIYNHYILNTGVSFEETPVSGEEMAKRIAKVQGGGLPWLVACQHNQVLGYSYATPWKERSAYRFSVESTVYVKQGEVGQGLGKGLYLAVIEALKETEVRNVLGGISLPNAASVALHEKLGFTKVAQLNNIGYKQGQWLSVGYWQLSLSS